MLFLHKSGVFPITEYAERVSIRLKGQCQPEITDTAFCTTYTECPRGNVRDFGRVFLMLNYTDITQNTYIQS